MSTHETDDADRSDMERLAAGHDDGLDALMERHAPALFGFLCRFVGDEDAADDLAQETFVRVHARGADFRPGQRFSPWLYTIAANLARNHLRARSRRPEVPLDSPEFEGGSSPAESLRAPGGSPDERAAESERRTEVRRAVAALPEELREAIVLCELEDRPVAEAAGILGATAKAVESRLYRGRGLLRRTLARWLAPA